MAKLHLHFKRMINYAFNRNARENCCCCTLVMHPVNEKHWKTKLWRKTRFHVAFYRRREKIIQLSKRKYWRATKSYWTTFYATKSHLGEKTNFVERLIHLSAEAFFVVTKWRFTVFIQQITRNRQLNHQEMRRNGLFSIFFSSIFWSSKCT